MSAETAEADRKGKGKMTQIRERAENLTKKLTLDEKIGMIHGAQLFQTAGVERLGIPPLKMSDGPMGVRQDFGADSWIPKGYSDDYVTYLPCNSALAATWNRQLAFETGSVLGEEARGRGKDVILAPGVNIKRSPLCGRNFEYFSEDPFLTKELAAAYVEGVQRWDVAACVKHFALNNQETDRLWVDVEADEQTIREIYLPAFYECVTKAGALTVMGAYNKVNGEHCCQSGYLLGKILRGEWKSDCVTITDWGAAHDTEECARVSLDIEMSVTNNFDEYVMADPLKKAVLEGRIPEGAVDEKVIRILMLMMRLHMMDDSRKSGSYNTPEHRQAALDVARESVVLLKNENRRLPLSEKEVRKVLLIGENAERLHANGGGSAEIKALYEISPLMGIRMLLGGNVQVDYVPGYTSGRKAEEAVSWQETSLENGGGSVGEDELQETEMGSSFAPGSEPAEGSFGTRKVPAAVQATLRKEALMQAGQDYDTVIYVGGLNHDQDSEGNDRKNMKLPYGQDVLIKELLTLRPDAVIVLTGGSPVEMSEWIDQTRTLVWGWYAGMEGGRALAEVLFGRVNPSGRLPETFYKTHMDCSAHCVGEFAKKTSVRYSEGIFVGYRYNETFDVPVQFCFGFGGSYTEFEYKSARRSIRNGKTCIEVTVSNTGTRAGAETVQLYSLSKSADKSRPAKELAGFEKIYLEAGETKTAEIALEESVKDRVIGVGRNVGEILFEV